MTRYDQKALFILISTVRYLAILNIPLSTCMQCRAISPKINVSHIIKNSKKNPSKKTNSFISIHKNDDYNYSAWKYTLRWTRKIVTFRGISEFSSVFSGQFSKSFQKLKRKVYAHNTDSVESINFIGSAESTDLFCYY